MKFLILLLLSSIAFADIVPGGNPCQEGNGTLQSVTGVTSGTALAQIIPKVTGQQIFVCAVNIQGVSGTTPTFGLSYGTGTNCATGTGVVMTPFATAAGTLLPFTGPLARVPVSNALCYLDGGTTPIQNYTISYIQK